MRPGSFQVKTPASRSSASLRFVTAFDQRLGVDLRLRAAWPLPDFLGDDLFAGRGMPRKRRKRIGVPPQLTSKSLIYLRCFLQSCFDPSFRPFPESRPLAKLSPGGAKAAIAVADIGPIPGTVIAEGKRKSWILGLRCSIDLFSSWQSANLKPGLVLLEARGCVECQR